MTLLNIENTYRVIVDVAFGSGILSNLIACANQATHFAAPRDRTFETREPIRIRRGASIVCDADGFQGPSDKI